jgi:hypothetical protein
LSKQDKQGGSKVGEKQKKPFYKRWWFWVIIVVFAIGVFGSTGDKDDSSNDIVEGPIEQTDAAVINEVGKQEEEPTKEEELVQELADKDVKEDVPREHKNALRSAQNYIDIMSFSEAGLYDQLTSEYGEQYPADAAQYAIENVVVDYFEEALESAINYQSIMPMSDKELFDQLTSDYGEKFTKEQAQYAIDNLP